MRKILFLLFLTISLVLSACGAAKPTTTINVTMTDFQFTPNSFSIPAGQEIAFNASNNGAVVHNFVIMNLGTNAGDTFDESDLANVYWKVDVKPGEDAETSFTAPAEPGEYQILCSVEGHMMAGMIGTLTVLE